jgi:hypothetical protein
MTGGRPYKGISLPLIIMMGMVASDPAVLMTILSSLKKAAGTRSSPIP